MPTEAEWVLAASGEIFPSPEGRGARNKDRFAFGELENPEKEIAQYANTSESGVNRTTPVWMYSQGKSPLDVMDMSGNVWEGQANFYNNDNDYLGLRGGSWDNHQDNARVSNRNNNHPNNRNNNIGFRVAAFHIQTIPARSCNSKEPLSGRGN